jgi:NAD(P)-dependent dehydrogenase (short-subunit alcohol dehydrogenase family)
MTNDLAGLSGKVALVTGGASGIGAGIARVLASRGVRVAIGDLDARSAAAVAAGLAGGSGLGLRLDVTDRASASAAVNQVEELLGPVDVLVNNAGVSSVAPFLDITDQDWDRLMNVNLRGVLIVTQRVLGRHRQRLRLPGQRPRRQHHRRGTQRQRRPADALSRRPGSRLQNPR